MQNILSSRNRQVLKKFALSNTLVALDFDGTLAPIVYNRHRAAIKKTTRDFLAKLTALYPCVVISGRARKDVRRRLRGIGVKEIVGNHGIEPWSTDPSMEKAVRCWLPLLKDRLRQFPGVALENKRYSVAIHYRREARQPEARAAIAIAALELGAVRLIAGKQVVNILPMSAPHKGLALERELLKMHCEKVIYIGDDDTDEDVFALPDHGRLLTIRVGLSRSSLARYYIPTQGEIDRVIQRLVDLRSSAAPRQSTRSTSSGRTPTRRATRP